MNVRLLVLGLLTLEPMHGYELRKKAEQSRIETWTGVLPGSIYHALGRLADEGFVARIETQEVGKRRRDVFAITDSGREALRQLVREAWQAPPRSFPTSLYGAALFEGVLPPDEERAAIERARAALASEIESWEGARALKDFDRRRLALFENGLEHLRADLALLDALLEPPER